MVPAPLRTRLALLLARLLLTCIRRILSSTPSRSAAVDGDDSENDSIAPGADSTAVAVAKFTRRGYLRAKAHCKNHVIRVRAARHAKAERAELELQAVLDEVGTGWQELRKRVVLKEPHLSAFATKAPVAQSSSTPAWAEDVRARSRIAMAADTAAASQSADEDVLAAACPQPLEETRVPNDLTLPPKRSYPGLDDRASDPEYRTVTSVPQPTMTKRKHTRTSRSITSRPDIDAGQTLSSATMMPTDIDEVVDETVIVLPLEQHSPPTQLTRLRGTKKNPPLSPLRSAAFTADTWPELPAEQAPAAPLHAGTEANLWPRLPDDPVLDRRAPAAPRSAAEIERQQVLEREQWGGRWNG